MFSVRSTENPSRIPITVTVVLATLLLALVLSVTAVFQVFDEYRMLGVWVTRPTAVTRVEVKALRQDIGARIIVRSAAAAVLLVCTFLTLWLQHRHLVIRQALNEVKLLAHDVLASLDQGVITTDKQAFITSINTAAIQLLGLDFDCLGRSISCISSAEVPLEELCWAVIERKKAVSNRDLTLDRSGRVVRLVASVLDLKDMRGTTIGCVVHLRDVTERLLMREQMWRMEQFASLSTLASGLLHEIKNPITAFIHVQLLEERLCSMAASGPAMEIIGVLKTEVRRLTLTLESFRNFASLQRLQLREVDVQEVLEDVVRLIRPQATQQQVRLELLRPERALPRLTLDSEKIEQAVLNLVLNGLEAMPQGGELCLRAMVEGRDLRVLVRDTGTGIPPEIQDHIFRPYFSTKDRGTGIGLTLVEKLVRQHHGHLDFRTGPGGTSFVITLPVTPQNGSLAGT